MSLAAATDNCRLCKREPATVTRQAERAALRKKIAVIVKHKAQPIMAAMKAEFAKLPEAEQKALLGCAPLPTGPLAVRRKR